MPKIYSRDGGILAKISGSQFLYDSLQNNFQEGEILVVTDEGDLKILSDDAASSAKEQRGECCRLDKLARRPPLKAGIWSSLSLELVLRRQGDCQGLPQIKSLPSDQPSVGFQLESGLDFEG